MLVRQDHASFLVQMMERVAGLKYQDCEWRAEGSEPAIAYSLGTHILHVRRRQNYLFVLSWLLNWGVPYRFPRFGDLLLTVA